MWSAPLGWALSCLTLLIPGSLLTKMVFPKRDVEPILFFVSSLVLGSALTTLPPALLGAHLKGFPSLYARVILPAVWLMIAAFFVYSVADKRIKLGWSLGLGSRLSSAVRIDGLEKMMFAAVSLFALIYFALNVFVVDSVGWTAARYYIPLAQMIYGKDVIPAYDPYLNLGEPVAEPPFPSILYSTLFFHLSGADYHALAIFPLLFGLGCALCVYAFARTFLDGRTAALSAIIFLATPLFMKCFAFSYLYSADLFALFFFSAAAYTYYLALKGRSRGMAVISGLSSCLAILSRSYCLYTLPLTILLMQTIVSGKRGQQALLTIFIALSTAVGGLLIRGGEFLLPTIGALTMAAVFLFQPTAGVDDRGGGLHFSLIFLALSSLGFLWYLRNFLLFGDPVYPQLGPLFHTGPLSDSFIGKLYNEVSAIYWRPIGESAHVGNALSTVLVPLLSFDFGIFLLVFKVSGFLTLLRNKEPLSNLVFPWMAVSYVTWLILFNYSTNYLIQILPPISIVCAIGMTSVYDKLDSLVGAVRREKRPVFVLTTVFSLFGYYLLYYLDLKGLLPGFLSSLSTSALYLNPTTLGGIAFSLLPFLVVPFAILATMVKGRWGISLPPVGERTKSVASTVLLAGLFLTVTLYTAPIIIGISEEGALGGVFSRGEAHELGAFIEHEVPQGAVIVSLTPEVMRLAIDRGVIYFFMPKGMLEMKGLLLMNDENAIIEGLREGGFTYFIVPEPTISANSTDAALYKVLKGEMIYNSYLFLAQRFKLFNLLQWEGGPFRKVFSNGQYAVYQLS